MRRQFVRYLGHKMLPRSVTCRERDRIRKDSMMPPYRDPLLRFMEKVEKDPNSGCWLWTGALLRSPGNEYALFGFKNKSVRAHRWAYAHLVGQIPEGMQIDHVCKVKRCVNPEHLRVVTNKQNCEHRGDDDPMRGVTYHKRLGKWVARVKHDQTDLWLGSFETAEQAAEVARAKRLELFTHNDGDRR